MRALFLFLIAAVTALGTLLVACGGDDEQQQLAQPEQSASASAAAPASDEGGSETAQQSAEPQPEPELSPEAQPEVPLYVEALAAYEAWMASVTSFEVLHELDMELGGLAMQITAASSAQLEPFMLLTSIDASSLLGLAGVESGEDQADPEQALEMRLLMSEDAAYLSMPQLNGWVDMSDQVDAVLGGLGSLLGANPSTLADPGELGQAFGCVDAVGGSAAQGQHLDQAVWFIECDIDVDALNEATAQLLEEQGIELIDSGIETLSMRLAISQASGAPVLVETEATLRDDVGLMGGLTDASSGADDDAPPALRISTTTHLISWNEPIQFPKPEPLVDGSLLGILPESDNVAAVSNSSSSENAVPVVAQALPTAEQLLDLVAGWVESADEMHIQLVSQAVIDGEARRASTFVRGSRSQGAFETTVSIDDASPVRLLWNRDGLWTSDADVAGQPGWTLSNPAVLGFAGMTVDQFLATPDRLNLAPLRSLLDLSWLSRTIEGDAPPVYELGIESGPLAPGDAHFDQIVAILKGATTELLAESVVFDAIDSFSTTLTVIGADGEIAGQVTAAVFETSAGRVELATEVSFLDDPVQFSQPTE